MQRLKLKMRRQYLIAFWLFNFFWCGFGNFCHASSITQHQIDLAIDLSSKKIAVKDALVLIPTESEVTFQMADRIELTSIRHGTEPISFNKKTQDKPQEGSTEGVPTTLYVMKLPAESIGKEITMIIEYEGTYPGVDFEKTARHLGLEVGGYLNEQSGMLLENAHWYPEIAEQKSLFTYRFSVRFDKPLAAVSSGNRTEKNSVTEFEMEYPTDQINLVFGPYYVTRAKYKNIELATYFTKNDPALADAYLEKMKKYMQQDECELGNYPYQSMIVVDSPIMTGLGFPGFTLIGEKLLSIPNMINTSLGHEILHNWYGSGIYIAEGSGNWTEGLVTYLSDHQFNVKQNGAAISRLGLLRQYTVATRGKAEKSLNQVEEVDASEDRAVAYQKSAMIFSMLKHQIGKKHFYNGLKALTRAKMYHAASWEDFKKAFEAESGQNLERFFKEWVYENQTPQITIIEDKSRPHVLLTPFSVAFTIHTEPLFNLDLPIEVQTETGVEKITVAITKPDQKVFMLLPSRAKEIRVDPEYRVMRRLNDNELPPNLSFVLNTGKEINGLFSTSLNQESRAFYEQFLKNSKIKIHEVKQLQDAHGPVVLLGPPDSDQKIGGWDPKNVPWHWQKGALEVPDGAIHGGDDSAALAWYGPAGDSQPVAWIVGYNEKGLKALSQRLGYYMPWSYVLFRDGKSVIRGEWEKNPETLSLKIFQ